MLVKLTKGIRIVEEVLVVDTTGYHPIYGGTNFSPNHQTRLIHLQVRDRDIRIEGGFKVDEQNSSTEIEN